MTFKALGKTGEHLDYSQCPLGGQCTGIHCEFYASVIHTREQFLEKALQEAADFLDAYYEFNPFEPQRNKKLGIEWMGTFKGSDEALDFLRNNLRVSAGQNNEAGETPAPRGSGAKAPERG